MVPYRGRLALRVARLVLALACFVWYVVSAGLSLTWVTALLAAYAVYAVGVMLEGRIDTQRRAAIALIADTAYFALWAWVNPESWPPALASAHLLASAVILHALSRAALAAGVALVIAFILPPTGALSLFWTVVAGTAAAAALAVYRRYLEQRMSNTLRHNVIIRSQAQSAREAERQRIAADFHDGPLQHFISFQMRLEVIRKLMGRDNNAAAEELRQLQELCRVQVTDLRSFVRSMRPADEGMGLSASLSRMTESFQRDTGISAAFQAGEIPDPSDTEVSLAILQIVREAMNNIQKHSGATRISISAERRGPRVEITIEDNGAGFPFAGCFTLEELDSLRMGPISIKQRVKMLSGQLTVDSKPGHGAKLELRIPV
jgi:signal transduction histidine kinase